MNALGHEAWKICEADYDAGLRLHWREVTEEFHDEMLNVLPPKAWDKYSFAVSEPWKDNAQGQTLYLLVRRLGTPERFEACIGTIPDLLHSRT